MNTQCRLYLDVDGVINAQAPYGWGYLRNGHARAEGEEFRIRWAPHMLEALSELDLDIVWTTTWRDDAANSLATLLDFGKDFRVLHPLDGVTTYPSIYWKMESIIEDQLNDPSPFLWLDDEIEFVHRYSARERGGYAITVNSFTGVSTTNIDQMRTYISNGGLTEAE